MTQRRSISLIVGLAILVFGILIYAIDKHETAVPSAASTSFPHTAKGVKDQEAEHFASNGVMTKADYSRLYNIQDTIWHTGKISDQNTKWYIAFLNSKPIVDTGTNEDNFHIALLSYISGVRLITPQQKHELYAAIVPYTSNDNKQVAAIASLSVSNIIHARILSPKK